MPAIVVEGLRKEYGAVRAVDDLSFSADEGEIFALLGPNGAGKTTTLEILEGFRAPTAGRVRVLGVDPAAGGRAFRERIGVVLQSAGFEEEFTVRELVRLHAAFYPRRYEPDEVTDLVGLADKRTVRVKGLSGGQRRRLDLALGLVGAPDLLFLDEPTTGFDPAARRHAWDLIDRLRRLGTTILLTTHYIEEAERLADRVAVLRAGRLVASGPPGELGTDGSPPPRILSFRLPPGTRPADLPRLSVEVETSDGTARASTRSPTRDVHTLTDWALGRGIDLPALTLTAPGLEETYLRLVAEAGHGDD